MAATESKKGKKKKGQKVNLNDFLAGGSSGPQDGKQVVTLRSTSWADTMDEFDGEDEFAQPAQQIALPTAPRAARQEIDLSQIPDKPPFTAYVGNLSYDVDEEGLEKFFSNLKVNEVRLVREAGRMKGYGYVEFGDKQSLVEALGLDGETFLMRKIKVDFATQSSRDKDGGFGKDGEGRRGNQISGEGDADDDWRGSAATRASTDTSSFGGRSGGYERGGYDRDRGGGGFDRDRGGGYDRDNRGGGFDRDRGYGGGSRSYGFDERDGGRPRDRNEGVSESESAGSWSRGPPRGSSGSGGGYNEDRNGYGSSSRRDDDYGSRRGGYGDRDRDRDYGRRDGGGRESYNRPSEPSGPPKERQRLQLAPRSKPAEGEEKPASSAPSVFGSAKPVDTSARERQIEERLQRGNQGGNRDRSDRDRGGDRGGSSFTSRDIRQNVERRVYTNHTSEGNDDSNRRDTEKPAATENPPVKKASSASIFGSAKPVDTTAREREIEEKLRKEGGDRGSSHRPSNNRDAPSRDQSRQSAWSRGPPREERGSGGGRHERKEKPLPKSIDEMPQYNEDRAVDISDGNKFAGLVESGDEGSD